MSARGEKRPVLNPNLPPGTVVEQVMPNGEIALIVGARRLGCIFPAVVAEPDGVWFGRRHGHAAREFSCRGGRDGRADARRHVLGELE